MIKIRKAIIDDLEILDELDRHISWENLKQCIVDGRTYVATVENEIIGWLRYGLFYDMYPFLNMIYFLEKYRRMGIGTKLMDEWENDMHNIGYDTFFTSTQADEMAQHFYRQRGYFDIGGFTFPGQISLEVLLIKKLEAENE